MISGCAAVGILVTLSPKRAIASAGGSLPRRELSTGQPLLNRCLPAVLLTAGWTFYPAGGENVFYLFMVIYETLL